MTRETTAFGRPITETTTTAFGRVTEARPDEEAQLKARLAEAYASVLQARHPNREAYLAALQGSVDYYAKLTETTGTGTPATGHTKVQETTR